MFDFCPLKMQGNKFVSVPVPSVRQLYMQFGGKSPVTGDYSGDTILPNYPTTKNDELARVADDIDNFKI